MTTIAVLGAGNGGLASAADLTLRGFDVRLFSRSSAAVNPVREAGGIRLDGAAGAGHASVPVVTTELGAAITGADLVMLTVPATAITAYAAELATVLTPGQSVLLNPGGTGGALALAHGLRRHGFPGGVAIGETATLTYACRRQGPAQVRISNVAPSVPFAALPGKVGDELASLVSRLYPAIHLRPTVLHTGLVNINAVEHPPQALLNSGWIEHTGGDFYFYREGTTPAVGRVIDQVDAERLAIAEAMGVSVESFPEAFHHAGYTTADAAATGSAYACLQASEANWWFAAPDTLDHRYVHEDVGHGLVPWSGWAALAGVATPVINSLITIASTVSGVDYATQGLTTETMGIAGVPGPDLHEFLETGEWG